ncbi:ABC transporter ATP-binding protein [Sphaerobacter sp.]|uniref:ABC transporter ATP-binding protein n=1 Tax=Sphaerobacter sp. TaxID=2099654 RepID=UPI001D71BF70|nr:ABC transporter ATP-binding protein [Sphaerobacter sp.]MBX5444443.1 ABC transporter ATP-binding protein [Sphaerobacter sp.]
MTAPALQLEDITKTIGGLTILDGIPLKVEPGERRAIIGPNGAGKTTLLNVIAGFLPPTRGRVLIFGHDVTRLPAHRRVDVGLMKTNQQPAVLRELTALENVMLALLRGRHRFFGLAGSVDRDHEARRQAMSVLEEWDLLDVAHERVQHLSHGYQRRLELAARFAMRPRLLLLDEPAAGLAADEIPAFLERLQRLPRDMTVILVEHSMRVVFAFADRITVLHHGAVLTEGTPDEVRQDRYAQEAYLSGGTRRKDA